jgi:phage baseplate assembly protein V
VSDATRAQEALSGKVFSMIARGTLSGLDTGQKMQVAQARLMAGETKDGLEVFEPYGFTSAALTGAELIAQFLDGDRSNGYIIVIADRRYRIVLESGEVAIHDDQGQKVHLTRNGIVIDGAGKPLVIENTTTTTIRAGESVRIEAPILECTGAIKDMCDTPEGKTMGNMRGTYNEHDHNENNAPGSPTQKPNQQM